MEIESRRFIINVDITYVHTQVSYYNFPINAFVVYLLCFNLPFTLYSILKKVGLCLLKKYFVTSYCQERIKLFPMIHT